MKATALICFGIGLGISVSPLVCETPPEVQRLLQELTPCSTLYTELEEGQFGNGIDQSYMQTMRQYGVQRALLIVNAKRRNNKVDDPIVVRALYFNRYDGPNSQVTDPSKLAQIRQSLQPALEEIARDRVENAPFFHGFERGYKQTKQWSGYAEFFSNSWLPQQETRFFPQVQSDVTLASTALTGDSIEVGRLLKSISVQRSQLNLALSDALLSRYDNSAVIELLVRAGADVNATGHDGTTPLMIAVDSPCNLRVLLANGAEIDARDKLGRTALKRAQDHKQLDSVRILQEAGKKTSGSS